MLKVKAQSAYTPRGPPNSLFLIPKRYDNTPTPTVLFVWESPPLPQTGSNVEEGVSFRKVLSTVPSLHSLKPFKTFFIFIREISSWRLFICEPYSKFSAWRSLLQIKMIFLVIFFKLFTCLVCNVAQLERFFLGLIISNIN